MLHTESSLGWGGQEIRILSESAFLNELGDFECFVVCDHDALIKERNCWSGVPVQSINFSKKRLSCLFELKGYIERIRPHVIISHSSTDSWLAAIARQLWFPKIRLIRVRHVSANVAANVLTRWLYKSADHLVTTSDAIRDHIIAGLKLAPNRVSSIPTGIDVSGSWRQVTAIERSQAKARLGIPEDEFVFGMISTLRSWKGHADALDALQQVSSARLIIIGDGPQESNIRERVQRNSLAGRVTLIGHTSEVRDIAAAFDGYLHPSYANEGVSQSLLQAMAMGIPVVASDIGGLNEVIEDRSTGILVPPRSLEELGNAMLAMMSYPELTASMMSKAREHVCRFHSIERRSTQMSDLIKEVVGA